MRSDSECRVTSVPAGDVHQIYIAYKTPLGLTIEANGRHPAYPIFFNETDHLPTTASDIANFCSNRYGHYRDPLLSEVD